MSWTRKELKAHANEALRNNYWKTCFLSAAMIALSFGTVFNAIVDFVNEGFSAVKDIYNSLRNAENEIDIQIIVVMVTLAFGLLLLTTIIKIVFNIFVKNLLEVGSCLFMKKNLNGEDAGQVADLLYAFDHDYIGHMKCMFWTKLYELLFTFLFLVPGVIKMYEYRMVPYLLSEHADLTPKEARKISKEMMLGNKWDAFLLDLSFIPWHIAGILCMGVLEIFYVMPYYNLTRAALYEKLKATSVQVEA